MKSAQDNPSRYLVFDLLRGFFMFGIIVNHLALYPNFLAFFTGATKMWVSFAEGFFMVSGFLVGALNREKVQFGVGKIIKKMTLRSLRLYLWTVYLTFVFTYWGNMMPAGSVKESLWIVSWGNLSELILKAITLRYTYGWADILPYYSVFLLISPFYLLGLRNGWLKFLFSLNVLVWYFRGDSIYLAIQILYFLGIAVGYYSTEIKGIWRNRDAQLRHKIRTIVYGTFLISLLASIISVFYLESILRYFNIPEFFILKSRVLNLYFDKQTVGIGRVLLSPVWFLAGYFLFSRFINEIKKYFGWLLLTFGKNSLYAYILHAFVIYPIPFYVGLWNLSGIWWNTAITAGVVILVYTLQFYTSQAFRN